MEREKVLIIDDDVDLCLLLKSYYLRKNYEVDITTTLNTAFQSITEKVPRYIFLSLDVCTHPKETIKNLREAAPTAQLIFKDGDKPYSPFSL